MPIYEYFCQKCANAFELVCSVAEYERTEKRGMECPKCKSSQVVRQISAFQVKTSKKS